MKERQKITALTIVSGALLTVAIVLGVLLFYTSADKETALAAGENYRLQLTSAYDRSYNEITGSVSDIRVALAKLRVALTQQKQSLLLGDVWRGAGEIQTLMSQLPMSHNVTGGLMKFVNQLGDYCYMLAQKLARGQQLSQEDRTQIAELEYQCSQVFEQLASRQEAVQWQLDDASLYYAQAEEGKQLVGSSLAESIEDYPTLIYDGPFSDSAAANQPKNDWGGEVSLEEAIEIAGRFFKAEYTHGQDEDNGMYKYGLVGKREDGTEIQVMVTRQGGMVHDAMLSVPLAGEDVRPDEERLDALIATAKAYLEERGYPEMQATYSQFYGGQAVLNFAPMDKGVLLYPDLVKVWIQIDTGEITGLDAHNYIMFHRERTPEDPVVPHDRAYEEAAKVMELQESRLVVIPSEDGNETLCYEFTGRNGKNTFAVYINAITGYEEDILQIVDAENGTFVY